MTFRVAVRAASLLAGLALGACASAPAPTPDDDGAPAPDSAAAAEERAKLQKIFESIFEVPADAPIDAALLDPKRAEDAQNIVRSDNVSLFPRADAVLAAHLAKQPDDLANLTWHAQLFLAWADSAALTSKSLASSVERLSGQRDKLSAQLQAGELSGAQKLKAEAKLEEIAWLLPLTEEMRQTLDGVASEKLAIGRAKTEAILKAHADTYEGYRLAADLARISEDWDGYGVAVAQLEKHNPDSNGLRFLRGVVAFARDKDYAKAARHLQEAIDKDPKFTKAQYYLALTYLNQRRFDDAVAALDQTLRISPAHPFSNAVRGYIAKVRGY